MIKKRPLPRQSAQQEEYDRLHHLLKRALILRHGRRCIGPLTTHSPILDVSHIFPKSVYQKLRFDLDNVVIQCRWCHDWFGAHPEEGGEWIRTVIPKERYQRLLTMIMHPDPGPMNLDAWERDLKQAIQLYSRTPRIRHP